LRITLNDLFLFFSKVYREQVKIISLIIYFNPKKVS
jgi:hypothetical protein